MTCGIDGVTPEVEDGNAVVRLAEEGQRRVIHQNSAVQIPAQPRQVLRRQGGMLSTRHTARAYTEQCRLGGGSQGQAWKAMSREQDLASRAHLEAGICRAGAGGGAVQSVVEHIPVAAVQLVGDGLGVVLQASREQHYLCIGTACSAPL